MVVTPDPDHTSGGRGREAGVEKYKYYAHFCKVGGAQVNLATLVDHFKISLQSTENGVSRTKSEEELIHEVDFQLQMKSNGPWHAESQTSKPDSSLAVRTLIPVDGISITSSYIYLSHDDILSIREGWGPSLCVCLQVGSQGKTLSILWREGGSTDEHCVP